MLEGLAGRRRMVRSFDGSPVEGGLPERLLALTGRAPSAGNTRGTAWVVLEGPAETRRYWDHVTTESWRRRSARWPGLSRAPVVLVALCSPQAYVERYGEPDKADPRLGYGPGAWPVPYWFGDSAFEVMLVLLGAEAAGLSACFLGNFRGEAELLAALGVPEGWRLFGAVLVGRADGHDHPSPSLSRSRPPGAGPRVHHGRWGAGPSPG